MAADRKDGSRREREGANAAPPGFDSNEELFATILESVSDGILVLDREFRLTYWNAAMERLSEMPREQLVDRDEHPWDTFPHLREQGVDELMRRAMAGEMAARAGIPYRLASGRTGYTDETYLPLRDRAGEIRGVVGVVHEVTERQSAEEELRSSEERYRSAVDLAPDGIVVLSPTGVITDCNHAVLGYFGLERSEVVGKHFSGLASVAEGAVNRYLRGFSAALVGEKRSPTEVEWLHSDGSAHTGDVRAAPLVVGGKTVGLLAMLRDTTERKREEMEHRKLEEQLRHGRRLEAIGTLAGGIAHDFNNLLTGILGSASMIALSAPAGSELLDNARLIERAAGRGAMLTRQLLGFARRGKLRNTAVDLGETMACIAAILDRTTHRRIEIAIDHSAEAPFVLGDPSQLEQVVMNLAVNARDAMPGGGQLRLATEIVDIGVEGNADHAELPGGRYVRLTVSDTGVGMSEAVKDHIFEPFFTTKKQGDGTGMGLPMVYGIVKSHHGSVCVRSTVGEGTEVELLFPRADEDDRRFGLAGARKLVRGSGLVLVVDDEHTVRTVMKNTLERIGYDAVVAASGSEALDYLQAHPSGVDLVILDLAMPHMDGTECFREIAKLAAPPKVLLATGHSSGGDTRELLDAGAVGVLQKPFSAVELSWAVARATQQDPAAAG